MGTVLFIQEGCLPKQYKFSSSYFDETPLLIDRKDDVNRLQKFFAVGVFFNIPTKMVDFITYNIRINFIKSARKPQAFEPGNEWLPGTKRRPFMGFYLKPQPLG